MRWGRVGVEWGRRRTMEGWVVLGERVWWGGIGVEWGRRMAGWVV